LFNIEDLVQDADICIHLAGITDVAYTNTQSDPVKDAQIRKVGVEGTQNLIKILPAKCKIVFPSTHVVFEGFEKETFDIEENTPLCPVLAYSHTKHQNEIDLVASDKNYIILRLASVYGYNESMRVGIVGNLFAKMSSQNQPIKLFGGGENYKPCVGVRDVANCMIWFGENDYSREVFHLVNESYTVKQIAEICKKHNPATSITSTNDEIPNKGYTLSNKKLLSTGFQFSQNLDNEIEKMIKKWKQNEC
jgi:nucleoside-diphosphate-sugar epimerase